MMRRCFGSVVPIIALAGGVLLGAVFPAQFLVFVLCVLMLIIGIFLFCS